MATPILYCEECEHEMIVSFSCKGRCFCPSCQEKRVWWSEWLVEEILENVPHRQLVFTIPKILRNYFLRNRRLLGDLTKCAWLSLKEFIQAIEPDAMPAAVICMHSFGNLLNFQPHLHAIVANGYFLENQFHQLPDVYSNRISQIMPQIFRAKVLAMLQEKEILSLQLARTIMNFRYNSGFSVHKGAIIAADNRQGLENLAHYCLRSPINLDKIFIGSDGSIHYRAKKIHPGYHGNFRIFTDPLEFLAEVTQHVAPKNFQLLRYYGAYSSANRAKRKPDDQITFDFMPLHTTSRVPISVRKSWARLIHKIFEVDPLTCPICKAKMKIKKIVADPQKIADTLAALGIPLQPRGQPITRTNNTNIVDNFNDYTISSDEDPFYQEPDFSCE